MRSCRRLVALASGALAGCGLPSTAFVPPAPADVPVLEQRVEADSLAAGSVVSLAVLYLSQAQPDRALSLLEGANRLNPADPAIPLLLSIAHERMGQFAAARDGYQAYRDSRIGVLAQHAAARIGLVEPHARREDVLTLIAVPRPALPSGTARVAVLPFAPAGPGAGEEGIRVGIMELTARDIEESGWEVVEGATVRMLLDEWEVEPATLADLSVGVEVARRLGVDRVVQGVAFATATGLEWTITVTTLYGTQDLFVSEMSLRGGAQDAVLMQRHLSRMVIDEIQADPREEDLPSARLESAEALAGFGQGLLAMDQGEINAAHVAFSRAFGVDPSFREALEMVALMQSTIDVMPLDQFIPEVARIGELQRAVLALRGSSGSLHQEALARLGASDRAVVTDVLGFDALPSGGMLDLVFTFPGDGP